MNKAKIAMLTVAFMLGAARETPATAANPASCRDTAPAVFLDASHARPEQDARDASARQQAGVIRASYSPPPRTGVERPRQAPAEPMPEPGGWATLVACLFGLGTIARRRMP